MITELTEVAERTYHLRVDMPNPLRRFNTFLIADNPGILIDPGPAMMVQPIEAAMARLGVKDLAYVIPTHLHMDHSGACGTLAQRFPQTRVLYHPTVVKHAHDPTRMIQGTKLTWGDDFADYFGPILPISKEQTHVVEDGQRIVVGNRVLEIAYAPGHSDDHIAIFDHQTRGLIAGEALGGNTPTSPSLAIPFVAPPQFDVDVYLATIAKLSRFDASFFGYAHNRSVGRDIKALLASVVEMTKVWASLIGDALDHGMTFAEITNMIREEMRSKYNVSEEGIEFRVNVSGFVHYLQRKAVS